MMGLIVKYLALHTPCIRVLNCCCLYI